MTKIVITCLTQAGKGSSRASRNQARISDENVRGIMLINEYPRMHLGVSVWAKRGVYDNFDQLYWDLLILNESLY